MTDVGRHHYAFLPVRWLLRDRYATIDRIARVNAPLLVIGGDATASCRSRRPAGSTKRPRDPKSLLIISGADHNDDSLLAGREMIDGVLRFLQNLPAA